MDNYVTIQVNEEFTYKLYKASNTIWYFDNLIENEFVGYNSVKFKNKDDVFVWLESVKIDGENYKGILVETGQLEIIPRSDAIDWMIIDNQRMIGGYTIRHYFDMLSDDEKVNFEIECGYRIDHGNDFFKADCSTAEGAIVALENFYSEKNIDGVLSCKDFDLEAENILLESKLEPNVDTHNKIKSILKISLLEELEMNGFPNFENIERVFTVLNRHKDQKLIEERIIYPDGFMIINKFWVGLTKNEGWKVLNLVD